MRILFLLLFTIQSFANEYDPQAMVKEGDAIVKKNPEKALPFYEKAYYAQFPSSDVEKALSNALHLAIGANMRAKKFDEAIALIEKAHTFPLPNLYNFSRYSMIIAFETGDYNRCVQLADKVLRNQAKDGDALFWGGRSYNKLKAYHKAISYFEKIPPAFPGYRDALALHGQALYHVGEYENSLKKLQEAQAKKSTKDVQTFIDTKVKKDIELEKGFIKSLPTPHFQIKTAKEKLMEIHKRLKPILEGIYSDLSQIFVFYPNTPIGVVIYDPKQRAFHARLGNPNWAAGVYDGEIRLPFAELERKDYELETLLRHEMVHLFVDEFTRNVVPTWLNEGLAQHFEKPYIYEGKDQFQSRDEAPLPRGFKDLVYEGIKKKKLVPYKEISGPFNQFGVDKARLAYAQSLLMTRYLVHLLGDWRLRRMLSDIYMGALFESAFEKETQMTPEEFVTKWLSYQKKQWKIR